MAKEQRAQYLVAAAVSLASVVQGLALAWATPVIPKFLSNETGFHITDKEISWMASLSSPGFMMGSLLMRFISDRFGRKVVILGSALPIVIGTMFVLNTATAWGLYVTRLLWGTGSGMIGTASAMYVVEISDKEIRGKLTSSCRYMRSFGSFLIMAVGPFVSYHAISYLLLVIPICYFIACCFIPESPYYLLKEGKINAARRSLATLSGKKDETVIENRLTVMRVDVQKETLRSGSIKELFTGKQYRKAVIITIGLEFALIMSGPNAIQQYFGRIVQETHTNVDISTMLIIYGGMKFIVGIFSSAIVDKVGRRPLLLFSFLFCGIILGIVGTYFLIQPTSSPYYSYIPFAGIILYCIISILGFETLVFVLTAEIFPLNVKSVALTLQNILGGFLNFLAVKGYQPVQDVAGQAGVFWFYGGTALLGALFTYFMVPETKGKSLREIQAELQGVIYEEGEEKLNNVHANGDAKDHELKELKHDYKA